MLSLTHIFPEHNA